MSSRNSTGRCYRLIQTLQIPFQVQQVMAYLISVQSRASKNVQRNAQEGHFVMGDGDLTTNQVTDGELDTFDEVLFEICNAKDDDSEVCPHGTQLDGVLVQDTVDSPAIEPACNPFEICPVGTALAGVVLDDPGDLPSTVPALCSVNGLEKCPVGTDKAGLFAMGAPGDDCRRGEIGLAADRQGIGIDSQQPHFLKRRAAALDDRIQHVSTSLHAVREPHELHFGSGHPAWRNHLQNSPRPRLGQCGAGHRQGRTVCGRNNLARKLPRAVEVWIERGIVVHFQLSINFEQLAAGPDVVEQLGEGL